jgi:hypothetical protein
LIFSTTAADKAAIVNDSICDASLKETMNTTVEKDATANDISDESKVRNILLTHSLFSDWQLHNSQGSKKVWTMPGFLFLILE